MNILLVEDEPLILMDIEVLLQNAGHTVVAVTSADYALEILSHQKIDVILTDIDMPGSMDGLRLAAMVRRRWPPIEIVVMSGKNRPTLTQLPLRAKFLSKPVGASNLLEAVDAW